MIKIGDKLGNFLIRAEIGRGGMGTIYFVVDTMLNREVALKVIRPQKFLVDFINRYVL